MITATKINVPSSSYDEIQEVKAQLKLVNPEHQGADIRNESTGISREEGERTLALISDNENLNDVLDHIKKAGFTIISSKSIVFSVDQAKEFYSDHQTQNYYDKMVKWLSSSANICALILQKDDAVKDWRTLMGPTNYKKARKTNPNSIRALFGKDASQNATHGSDSDVSAKKEIYYIFGDSLFAQQQNLITDISSNNMLSNGNKVERNSADDSAEVKENSSPVGSDLLDEVHEVPGNTQYDHKITPADKPNEEGGKEENTAMVTVDLINDKETILNNDTIAQGDNADVVAIDEAATTDDSANVKDMPLDVENPTLNDILNESQPKLEEERLSKHEAMIEEYSITEATKVEEEGTLQEEEPTAKDDTISHLDTVPESSSAKLKTDSEAGKDAIVSVESTLPEKGLNDNSANADNYTSMQQDVSKNESVSTESVPIKNAVEEKEEISVVGTADVTQASVHGESKSKPVKKNSAGMKSAAKVNGKEKGGDAAATETSRIRPPSIKKGQSGTTDATGKFAPRSTKDGANKMDSANYSAGKTRIARLSPSATKNSVDSSSSDKKKPSVATKPSSANGDAKKPATKVFKNLPRVATISATKASVSAKEDPIDSEKKARKRISSNKSFISRLTAPTVASANKKADSDVSAPIHPTAGSAATRASVPSKRSSIIKAKDDSPSNSKVVTSSNKQK